MSLVSIYITHGYNSFLMETMTVFTYMFVYLSILSVCLCIYQSAFFYLCLCLCVSVCHCLCIVIYVSICLFSLRDLGWLQYRDCRSLAAHSVPVIDPSHSQLSHDCPQIPLELWMAGASLMLSFTFILCLGL